MLETVRELKALGIDVYFEKEKIHSLSGDGELMLSILASFAQAESLSVSENCKWRIRKDFKQGKPGNITIFGYRQVDGKLTIMPEEAAVVRHIFAAYLGGLGKNAIAKVLQALGVPPLRGGRWNATSVFNMLRNEKYVGDLLMQKCHYPDHLTKQKRPNLGELPQYLIENAHEAIIDRETFAQVQAEIARRVARFQPLPKPPQAYPFTGLMTCDCCGKHYRRKIARAGTKYAAPVWICSTFNSHGRAVCPAKQIPEDILEATAAQALGLPILDVALLRSRITGIQVHDGNRLVFEFRDGHTVEAVWEDHSRKWSEEAKAAARERQMQYVKSREV